MEGRWERRKGRGSREAGGLLLLLLGQSGWGASPFSQHPEAARCPSLPLFLSLQACQAHRETVIDALGGSGQAVACMTEQACGTRERQHSGMYSMGKGGTYCNP